MMAFDDEFLSDDHLDNIDNDNEGDDGIDENSSDNEEIKKMKRLSLQNTTLCFLFKSIHDNYENLNSMR